MKRFLTVVTAAALLSGAAFAAGTNTDSGPAGANMEAYGSKFSKSVGSTFYSDPEMTTMRNVDELSSGWTALSQEDRDMVLAECARYRADMGGSGQSLDGNSTGSDPNATGTPSTGAVMGISVENMKTLCDTTDGF